MRTTQQNIEVMFLHLCKALGKTVDLVGMSKGAIERAEEMEGLSIAQQPFTHGAWHLNNSPQYGGWEIRAYNHGSGIVQPFGISNRMKPNTFWQVLRAAEMAANMAKDKL